MFRIIVLIACSCVGAMTSFSQTPVTPKIQNVPAPTPSATVTELNYLVHITAFNENRPVRYFANLTGVTKKLDNKGIFHYYLGGFATAEEAEKVKKEINGKGYPYAYIVDVAKVRKECNMTCGDDPSIDEKLPPVMKMIRNIHHLFFDFDKNTLRSDSKTQLNRLATILSDNASYKVEFKGHTDSKGSVQYNQVLSEKRSETAKNYLTNRGIRADRVKTSSYGKDSPIAYNEIDGKDMPQGRKFNRRVEIFITDAEGNVLNALVEPIDIPTELLIAPSNKIKQNLK
jgi:outer membrane protein OmpA-like peptidoglycan-associated protein